MSLKTTIFHSNAQAVSVMQPYFFPYLGYFSLIKHTDYFVAFDPVQYMRKAWMNRNRVLKPGEGWQYLTVPMQPHSQQALIKEVLVQAGDEWKVKMIRQLEHYKKKAPYYKSAIALLEKCFDNPELSLSRLNLFCLEQVCEYINLPFAHAMFSDLDLAIGEVNAPDEWALRTCKALGVTTYINQPGGRSFFDTQKYEAQGINLQFIDFELVPYNQHRPVFEPGLSIIDALMFNSPEQIIQLLDYVRIAP